MGAEVIQANYDELESIAVRFGQWAESNTEMSYRLRQCVEKLIHGDWIGKGSEAFFNEMGSEVLPAVDRLTNALQQSQSIVNQINFIIQEAEEEAARPFRGQSQFGLAGDALNAAAQFVQNIPNFVNAVVDAIAERMKWQRQALAVAGINSENWDPAQGFDKNRETILKVYKYYGQLFQEHPELLWAGMARVGGMRVFYPGFEEVYGMRKTAQDIQTNPLMSAAGRSSPGALGSSIGIGMIGRSSAFLEQKLLSMQKEIFMDLAWQHEAYRQGGIEQMRDLAAKGQLDQGMLNAWEDIASGDRARIERGNTELLYREQHQIIQDDYEEISSRGFLNMEGSAISEQLSDKAKSPMPGGRDFREVVPDGNLANFNDRWQWIQNDMLPRWLEINRTDPGLAQRLARGLVRTGP